MSDDLSPVGRIEEESLEEALDKDISRISFETINSEEEEDQMSYQKGYHYNSNEGWYRRCALTLLFVGIHYLLFTDFTWQNLDSPSDNTEPIRGNAGLRPIGSICHTDPLTGRTDRIRRRHAIVFDAGSTGSRIHVYEFEYCGAEISLLVDEVFEEVKPGLSSYHADPGKAAGSLKPLLKRALERVPNDLRTCTPLIVKATAGLRLLPSHAVTGILEQVRKFVGRHAFHLPKSQEAVSVMDGAEEAVFAWATVNFLMDRLKIKDADLEGGKKLPETSVVMDMGGGSTQIVFAVDPNQMSSSKSSNFDKYYYKLKLHGQKMELYQQSHLGYGLMEARKQIKSTHIKSFLSDGAAVSALKFPCFPKGYREHFADGNRTLALVGDMSSWDACLNIVKPIFRKDTPCSVPPCSFNGVHQPPIHKDQAIVAFSYFFDRLIPLGLTSPLTLFDIDREGRQLCGTPGARHRNLLNEESHWCLDLAYIYSLLRVGYEIDIDQRIVVTKQINGYEAGWSLGAALKLLEDAPSCFL